MKEKKITAKGNSAEEAKFLIDNTILHHIRASSWIKKDEVVIYEDNGTFIAEVTLIKLPPCSFRKPF